MSTGGQYDDGAGATRWMRGAFAAFYVALSITNFVTVTGPARPAMTALAAATAVVLAFAALPVAERPGLRLLTGGALGFLPVLDSVAQVAMTGQLHFTTLLMLALVGVGAAVPSRRIAAGAAVTGLAGWAAAVAGRAELRTGELGHYVMQLVIAALLGAILHEAVRRRQRQLRDARDEVAAVAERFTSLFHASPAGVGIADGSGTLVAVNPAFCELAGLAEDELVGASAEPYLAGGATEQRIARPDGTERWVWLTVGHSRDGDGSWTLLQLQDITDRRLAEAAVRESDRLLAAVSAAARRIRTGEDARGTIITAVRELAEADNVTLLEPAPHGGELVATGVAGADVLGTRVPLDGSSMTSRVFRDREPIFLSDPAQDPRVSPALLKLVEGRSMLWQPVLVDGRATGVLAVGWKRRVETVSDHRARAVALLADETALALEHERLLHRLEQMAFTDTLTGLPNRRAWQRELAGLMAAGGPLTVAVADLDHFKRYNDTYGHPAGDELLHRAAAAFAAQLAGGDLIARWGGEEFVIALPGRTPAEAAAVLDRVRRAMPEPETCSIGYAVWDGAEPAEHLIERADLALYTAKNSGRDAVCAAPGTMAVPL
ncbi:diguanylate cyclase [Actinoplanes sp. NPDC024001]|uniref:sensor domain-containing diguanylate cyclase n=1 Tax=Actinoplanes sp. NPDC024001 TaxID=3154598 RepID=UPI0034092AF2